MSETNDRLKQQADWYGKYYGQLTGATILQTIIGIDPEFGDVWPNFKVKLENGDELEIQIQRDEEGNGPGFISGIPMPGSDTQGNRRETGTGEQPSDPRAGDRSYYARSGALLFADHGATVGMVSDDREVAALIEINNGRETVRIGEDTGNPGTYMVDLIVGDAQDARDAEATLLLSHLSQGDVIEHVTNLIEGQTDKRNALMLDYAAMLLEDQHAAIWHSGGGIMLVAGFYGDHRITACSDDTELSTYALEVTHETKDGTDSVLFKEGLTPSQLVNLWSEQRRKLT